MNLPEELSYQTPACLPNLRGRSATSARIPSANPEPARPATLLRSGTGAAFWATTWRDRNTFSIRPAGTDKISWVRYQTLACLANIRGRSATNFRSRSATNLRGRFATIAQMPSARPSANPEAACLETLLRPGTGALRAGNNTP